MLPEPNAPGDASGLDLFIAAVSERTSRVPPSWWNTARFLLRIAEDFAYIRLRDLWRPLRFLRQMAGAPPYRFATRGFTSAIVDDENPARHYTAFVFVGFWLPARLAKLALWLWEIAGFVRYGGRWSHNDMACGEVGIRHGRLLRKYGQTIMPALIASELAERPPTEGRG